MQLRWSGIKRALPFRAQRCANDVPHTSTEESAAFLRSTCGSSWFVAGLVNVHLTPFWGRCMLPSMLLFCRSLVLAPSDAVTNHANPAIRTFRSKVPRVLFYLLPPPAPSSANLTTR